MKLNIFICVLRTSSRAPIYFRGEGRTISWQKCLKHDVTSSRPFPVPSLAGLPISSSQLHISVRPLTCSVRKLLPILWWRLFLWWCGLTMNHSQLACARITMLLQATDGKSLQHRHTNVYQGLLCKVLWWSQLKHWIYSTKCGSGYLIEDNAVFYFKPRVSFTSKSYLNRNFQQLLV
jgi:hypothetical protein